MIKKNSCRSGSSHKTNREIDKDTLNKERKERQKWSQGQLGNSNDTQRLLSRYQILINFQSTICSFLSFFHIDVVILTSRSCHSVKHIVLFCGNAVRE